MPVAQLHITQSSPSGLDVTFPFWAVREEKDEYGSDLPAHLALADVINDKLTKAEALSWLLHGAGDCPEHARSVTAQLIAELIGEALAAHEKQWDNLRQNFRQ